LRWLNNVRWHVFSPGFLAPQGSRQVSSGIGPCFPLAGGLCKFYAKLEENNQFSQPLLMQYKQQANPLLSMHYYTPLLISGNDKNKEIAVLSQCKLTLNRKKINGSVNS
jgi:hypothetical protein